MYAGSLDSSSIWSAIQPLGSHASLGLPEHYPVVATEHLRLRAFALADISLLIAMMNDDHYVADTVLDAPHPYTFAHARRWVQSHAICWEQRRSVHWAISLLADDRLVGYIGLHHIHLDSRGSELNFWMGPGRERQSHATEATQAALAFAFSTMDMNRVSAHHLARDLLVEHTLTKIGFQQEGLLRQAVCKWDHFEDLVVKGLLKSDWLLCL